MKKRFYGIVVAALLLFVTGCGAKTPEEVIQTASDNMDKLENYNMKIKVEMAVSAEGETMEMNMNLDGDVDVKNNTMKMKLGVDFAGFKLSSDSYTVTKDGKTTTYTKNMDSDEWTKETEEENETTKTVSNISRILTNAKSIEEKKLDEKNKKAYIITISKEESEELFNSMGAANEDMEGSDLGINGDVKLEVVVDTEKYYIESLTMDFLDAIEQEEGMTYDKMLMTFEFSKFNEVGEVKIPEAILNSAKEESVDDEFNYSADENSAYGILDAARLYYAEQMLAETPVLEGITISDLNITGKLPENSAEVTVTYNGDGTINIDVMEFDDSCYEVINSTVEETICP